MDNYERFIRELLDRGATPEGIAKGFAETMNKVEAEQKAKASVTAAIDEHRRIARTTTPPTLDSMVSGVTAFVASNNPKWTVEDVNMFYKNVKMNIETTEKIINTGPMEGIKALVDVLSEAFPIKERAKVTDNRKLSDEDIVKNFLKIFD